MLSYLLRNKGEGGIIPTDPSIGNVSLLMHFDGANNGTTFTEVKGKVMTRAGTTLPTTSTAQSKFGGSSGSFAGASSFLSTPAAADLRFGTGNLTVEAWIYLTSAGSQYGATIAGSWSSATKGWKFSVNRTSATNNGMAFYIYNNASAGAGVTYPTALTQNTWHHVAVTRSGTTVNLWLNGVSVASGAVGTDDDFVGSLFVGTSDEPAGTAGVSFPGYIEDLRITKGLARYTANFTPPVAPFPDV